MEFVITDHLTEQKWSSPDTTKVYTGHELIEMFEEIAHDLAKVWDREGVQGNFERILTVVDTSVVGTELRNLAGELAYTRIS
jgi:hypothetical protein